MSKYQISSSSESVEQICLFRWAAYQEGVYPELALLYHIPNGGKRDIGTARKLKAEGVRAGVPDICLPVSRCGKHGLYIEMKVGNNKTTDNQDIWLERLMKQGYSIAVCYGWENAKEVIMAYLKGENYE